MSYPLYNRSSRIELFTPGQDQGVLFDGDNFRIDFNIELGGSYTQNKAKLILYNPNQTTISKAREQGSSISFFAGYGDVTPRLITADIISAKVTRQTSDVLLTLSGQDSSRLWRFGRVNRTWKRATSALEIIRQLSKDIGVVPSIPADASDQPFDRGFVAFGQYKDVVQELASNIDLEFTFDDGQAVFTGKGQKRQLRVIEFSPSSGVIGSPDLQKRRVINFTSLLRGEIRPKQAFKISGFGDEFEGFYRATKVVHKGSSWDNEYSTAITGTRIQA